MQVLIIDDDLEDTELFCCALKEIAPHANCQITNSPEKGLTFLINNDFTPDIILLDSKMPLMEGKDCLIRLKEIQRLQHTRIIMYSGMLRSTDASQTKKCFYFLELYTTFQVLPLPWLT